MLYRKTAFLQHISILYERGNEPTRAAVLFLTVCVSYYVDTDGRNSVSVVNKAAVLFYTAGRESRTPVKSACLFRYYT